MGSDGAMVSLRWLSAVAIAGFAVGVPLTFGVVLRRDTLSASEAEALVAPFKALDGAGVEACFAGSVADDLFRLVGDLARHDAADVLGGGLSADEVAALSCYLRCCNHSRRLRRGSCRTTDAGS